MGRIAEIFTVFVLIAAGLMVWIILPDGGVTILAYHDVNGENEVYNIAPDEFERQMSYLAENGYTAISLADFFAARAGRQKLPDKPVIITFDDGYTGNCEIALPIMEKYNMRATVFIIASQVGQPEYLSWDQIRLMQKRHTEIGAHTLNHVALTEVSIPELQQEVSESKAVLERNLGIPVQFLAYPFGKFNSGMFGILERAGYHGACTGKPGLNYFKENAYSLKRVNIPKPKYGLWEFRLRLIRAKVYSKLGV